MHLADMFRCRSRRLQHTYRDQALGGLVSSQSLCSRSRGHSLSYAAISGPSLHLRSNRKKPRPTYKLFRRAADFRVSNPSMSSTRRLVFLLSPTMHNHRAKSDSCRVTVGEIKGPRDHDVARPIRLRSAHPATDILRARLRLLSGSDSSRSAFPPIACCCSTSCRRSSC